MVFLVDGMGALATAILTGIVLPAVNEYIGMPLFWLKFLALVAMGLAIYSFSCHFFLRHHRARFLQLIIFANLLYCLLTATLMFRNFDALQPFGIAYFTTEILVILVLVFLEYRTMQNMQSGRPQ